MIKVKVSKDKVEITGIADDDLKLIKSIFPAKKKVYAYVMDVGFLISNEEGDISYQTDKTPSEKNKDLYR